MEIPRTFKPEKNLNNNLEKLINEKPHHPGALAIAVSFEDEQYLSTDIMVWTPTMDRPEKVARRFGSVHGLCVYKNLLYDAGENGKVIETLNHNIIARRDHTISSLCVHNGVMYDGGLRKIFKTDKGKVIAERNGWVNALCSCNGELYDAGSYKQIIRTFDNHIIDTRKGFVWIHALGSHNNILYDATDNKIRSTFEKKVVTRRPNNSLTLFSFNNKLYDAGQYYHIYETKSFFQKKFLRTEFDKKYRSVTAVQPIPFWLAHQLLQRAPS